MTGSNCKLLPRVIGSAALASYEALGDGGEAMASRNAIQPSTIGVELRKGWPMHVGVLLEAREIVWRAPIARTCPSAALADAKEALDEIDHGDSQQEIGR